MEAPDPTYDIAEYEVTLQQTGSTDIQTQRVAAVAGATHTFENLQSGSEYTIVNKGYHPEGILIKTTDPITGVVWTLPHEPSDSIIYQTSSSTATVQWTAANQPFFLPNS
ncbi:uncharacterized protein LOC117292389 [Asterias rubens]|uniref:uncharacterized protein LOC117292389 n=1 Tax=Asterias rubens TaxID=7604 RepID=UPI0014559A1F|nr:uncharacterized protein LOC117292389 [Asterias rubens]